MKSQSRKMSLVEALSNQVVAFLISVGASFLIFPAFGIEMAFWKNLGVVTCFAIISIIRSYVVRRVFEAKTVRQA